MELIRCPNGHFYNPAETPTCPECGIIDPPPPPPLPPDALLEGWLVCTEGSNRGSDFRIHNGINFIGRSLDMDICITGDNHISAKNAAVIAYDDQDKVFYIGNGMGHNIVRQNGQMVLGQNELNPYDVITVGTTKLLFVPLCSENFDWSNYDEEIVLP